MGRLRPFGTQKEHAKQARENNAFTFSYSSVSQPNTHSFGIWLCGENVNVLFSRFCSLCCSSSESQDNCANFNVIGDIKFSDQIFQIYIVFNNKTFFKTCRKFNREIVLKIPKNDPATVKE